MGKCRTGKAFRQPLKLIEHDESGEIANANGYHLADLYF